MRALTTLTLFTLGAALAGCSGPRFVRRPESASRDLIIRQARVFEARAARLGEPTDVRVTNGVISAIAPQLPAQAGVPELTGGIVAPGLVDVHTHVGGYGAPPWSGQLPDLENGLTAFLYCGVTTLLDAGNHSPDIFTLRDDVAAGRVLGPRVFAAGPMFTARGGHPAALFRAYAPAIVRESLISHRVRELDDADAARAALAELAPLKPDFIKVVVDRIPLSAPHIDAAVLGALVTDAHARGLRVVAHIGTSDDAKLAAEAGVDALIHGVYIEPLSDAALEAIVSRRVSVAPTMSVFDAVVKLLAPEGRQYTPLELHIGSEKTRDALANPPQNAASETARPWLEAAKAGQASQRANTSKLRERGVQVLAGSDSSNIGHFPGAGLHRELDALVESGYTPAEALRLATFENARFLAGEAADFGEVAVGKRGDLLVLAGDSLDQASALHDIKAVVLAGTVLERE